MLCGNAITGISVSLGYILKELWCVISSLFPAVTDHVSTANDCCSEIHNTAETLPGASPLEARRPLAIEALRLGLMPTINQMRYVSARSTHTFPFILPSSCDGFFLASVMGIVAIPGMMVRAILDGADIELAGCATADDHRVHDLCVECAFVHGRYSLGSDDMRRF
jgi:hypothetical protein